MPIRPSGVMKMTKARTTSDHGNGTSHSNDQADDNPSNTNAPTLNLDQAAADAGVTVDEYCAAVLAAHEAENEDEADDDSTDSTIDDDGDDDSNGGSSGRPTVTTIDHPSGGSGSHSGGSSGSDNSGNSGSNSGRGGNSGSDSSESAG